MAVGAKWYLTKEGRAEFGRKAAELERKRASAEAQEVKAEEIRLRRAVDHGSEWWRDARIWVGVEDEHDPVMVEACEKILRQCPDWGAVLKEFAQSRLEPAWRLENSFGDGWDAMEWDHLKKLEVEAVIAEARQVLRANEAKEEMQKFLQLTLAI